MRYLVLILLVLNYCCASNNESAKRDLIKNKDSEVANEIKLEEVDTKKKKKKQSRRSKLVELIHQDFPKEQYGFHFFRHNDAYALITDKLKIDNYAIAFFEADSIAISHVFDIKENNPFKKYVDKIALSSDHHQTSGYIIEKQSSLSDMYIPNRLKEVVPKGFTYSNAQYTNNTFQNTSNGVIVNYQFSLLPIDEVLETVAIPGISVLNIINGKGEVIGNTDELPYLVEDARLSTDEKYLLFTHQNNYQNTGLNKDKSCDNCLSIWSVDKRNIIYQKCDLGFVFVNQSKSKVVYFQSHAKEEQANSALTHFVFDHTIGILNVFDTNKEQSSGKFDYELDKLAILEKNNTREIIQFDSKRVQKIPLENENYLNPFITD